MRQEEFGWMKKRPDSQTKENAKHLNWGFQRFLTTRPIWILNRNQFTKPFNVQLKGLKERNKGKCFSLQNNLKLTTQGAKVTIKFNLAWHTSQKLIFITEHIYLYHLHKNKSDWSWSWWWATVGMIYKIFYLDSWYA